MGNIEDNKTDAGRLNINPLVIVIGVILGITLRYIVMLSGHNFDFDSYCIVGRIAGNLGNVYAETERYNYGPVFFAIQGILYRISQIHSANWVFLYRVLIVAVLTITDFGISAYIAVKHSVVKSLAFFLNPISIIITGYHNQFDNMAVLFVLLSTLFYNEEEKFNRKDFLFVIFFSLSLIIKHICFILPVYILLKKSTPLIKRVFYAFISPMIFLFSFLPFVISNKKALNGVINNIFLYRSFNNSPLLLPLYQLIGFPQKAWVVVFILLMIFMAFIVRGAGFEYTVLIYLMALVAFSSAIADQYLVIPVAALCILDTMPWNTLYFTLIGLYCILNNNEVALLTVLQKYYAHSIPDIIASRITIYGYQIAVVLLLFALIKSLVNSHNKERELITL